MGSVLLDALALRDQHASLLFPDRDDPDVIDGHAIDIDPVSGQPIQTDSPTLLARLAGVARLALPAGRGRQPAPAAEIPDARSLQTGRAELQTRLDKLLERCRRV